MAKASQVYGVDPNKICYGFDIYRGDDDNGPVQFGAAMAQQSGYPLRNFCWIKATQGSTYVDPHYADHATRANQVAINSDNFVSGPYTFVDPQAPAKDQVDLALKTTQSFRLTGNRSLIHMLDIEPTYKNGQPVHPDKDLAFEMAHLIKMETGRWPILYFGDSDYQSLYSSTFPSNLYTLVIARYANISSTPTIDPDVIKPVSPCAFHQYTGNGRLQGQSVKQNFDLDVYFGSLNDLKAKHCY